MPESGSDEVLPTVMSAFSVALFSAVKQNSFDVVNTLLTQEYASGGEANVVAAIKAKDEQGYTVLSWAISEGDPGIIRRLMAAGADINGITEVGERWIGEKIKGVCNPINALRDYGYQLMSDPATRVKGVQLIIHTDHLNTLVIKYCCFTRNGTNTSEISQEFNQSLGFAKELVTNLDGTIWGSLFAEIILAACVIGMLLAPPSLIFVPVVVGSLGFSAAHFLDKAGIFNVTNKHESVPGMKGEIDNITRSFGQC